VQGSGAWAPASPGARQKPSGSALCRTSPAAFLTVDRNPHRPAHRAPRSAGASPDAQAGTCRRPCGAIFAHRGSPCLLSIRKRHRRLRPAAPLFGHRRRTVIKDLHPRSGRFCQAKSANSRRHGRASGWCVNHLRLNSRGLRRQRPYPGSGRFPVASHPPAATETRGIEAGGLRPGPASAVRGFSMAFQQPAASMHPDTFRSAPNLLRRIPRRRVQRSLSVCELGLWQTAGYRPEVGRPALECRPRPPQEWAEGLSAWPRSESRAVPQRQGSPGSIERRP